MGIAGLKGGLRGLGVTGTTIVACVASLVLLHGGYFGMSACAFGLVATSVAAFVWLRRLRGKGRVPLVPLLFAGVAAAYLVSACANGATLTTLAEAGSWAACVGAALLAGAQDSQRRARMFETIAWVGVATAALAFLVFCGVVPLEGGVTDGRLEFTFTYANAAAAWFGACALLCLLSPSSRLRAFAALPVAAMLLTQSAGATLSFLLASALAGTRLVRAGAWETLLACLLQGVLGVAVFAAMHEFTSPAGLVAPLAAAGLCYALGGGVPQVRDVVRGVDPRKGAIALAAAVAVALVAAAVLMPERIHTALYSATERACHVRDGIALWLAKPLVGVGPNNWQYLFPYVQTAPYFTTAVHSSPVQVLDDAGVLALVPLVAACVLGVRAIVVRVRQRDAWALAELAATTLLLVHAVLDFDLRFAGLTMLVAALLSGPDAKSVPVRGIACGVAGIACAAACAAACAVGLFCATTSEVIARSNARGDGDAVEHLFWRTSWATGDPAAQRAFVTARFAKGDFEGVASSYELVVAPSSETVLEAAASQHELGSDDLAAQVIVEALTSTPYDEGLLEGAREFERSLGVDPSWRERFDAAVIDSARLIGESDLSAWQV